MGKRDADRSVDRYYRTGGSGLKDEDPRISRTDYECGYHRTGGRYADGKCNTENGKTLGIINSITTGFGGTLGSIGIIIGFGVMMGQIFERTGAAKRMAQTFLKLFGKGREEEALGITGFLVSIPIFCDSGFVILAPIAKAISKVTKISDFTGRRTGGRYRYHPYAGTSDTGAVGRLRYFRVDVGKIPPVWYRD